jgi:formylglycine-generating enzyme required for sulfatase activity
VIRGGSWNNNAERLAASNRNNNRPDRDNNNLGLRVARIF